MMLQRGDHAVVHEPFSHRADFGVVHVGGRKFRSERELIAALLELASARPLFFKDTTDFRYPSVLRDRAFLRQAGHSIMIRHPAAAVASHARVNPRLERDEVGFARLYELFEAVAGATGTPPVVVDADDLVASPHALVEAWCARVGIPFVPEALSWKPGMLPAWRRTARWHRSVGESDGFETRSDHGGVDVGGGRLAAYVRYHLPYYERMRCVRLRPEPAATTAATAGG
jgi:Sulfotransferase domain